MKYDFCPKCGALVRDGVCTSCGTDYNEVEKAAGMENNVEHIHMPDEVEPEGSSYEVNQENESEINNSQPNHEAENETDNSGANDFHHNERQYNYYGGQKPIGNGSDGKKGISKAIIAMISITCLVVIALVIYIGIQVAQLSKGGILLRDEEETDSLESSDSEEERSIFGGDREADDDWEKEPDNSSFPEYDADFKRERENYDPSQIKGPYFEEFVNCIDESVPYQINREFYEKVDEEAGVCMQISYIQLKGDIPNLESINKEIKEQSLLYAQVYLEQPDYFEENAKETGTVYRLNVESYVTYNDSDTISIVLDQRMEYYYQGLLEIYGININLATGTVLDNTEILNVDEKFVEDFCERSRRQNGENSMAIEEISNGEKMQLFQENSSLIIFYTPIGLEVGYNYTGVNGYSGWITVSLEDYEKYLIGF